MASSAAVDSSAQDSSAERPEEFPFPFVWSRFHGLKPIDGKIPEFWIQDMTNDTIDFVLDAVCESFLKEAVLSKALQLYEDSEAVETVRSIWRAIMETNLSLVAFTSNGEGEVVFAGCNILSYVNGKEKPWDQLQDCAAPLKEIIEASDYIEGKIDLKKKYGLDHYLGALGLWVEPVFRGQGIGVELLKARVPLCQMLGLPLTVTLFTGTAAQKCALKAGFEILAEEKYVYYRNSKGYAVFANAEGTSFMLMAMNIELEDNTDPVKDELQEK